MRSAASEPGRQAWPVALALAVWLLFSLWARPLMLPDEGRYVGVAWEMLRSGDWLTPTLDGLPYFHKPPLFYWITGAAMAVFGPHAWAARLASVLGAALAAGALYAFTRRRVSERAARAALLVLAAQPLYFLGGQFANLDMLVAGCISATVLLLAEAALRADEGRPFRALRDAAYGLAAVGVLAKGLIGFVLPGLVIVLWVLLSPRRIERLLALLSVRGAVLFLAIVTPWFVAMQQRFAGFLDYFFVVQHFKRFAAGGFNNAQPVWFYPVVLTVFFLPVLPWLWSGAGRGYFRDPSRGHLRRLMVVWLAVVVGFFSLPQSKLLGYVLPAVPPLAYLLADAYLARAPFVAGARGRWLAGVGLMAAVGLGAVIYLGLHPQQRSHRDLAFALSAQRQPGEPVVMVGNYFFDVPFYAGLRAPVPVLDDWHSPETRSRDNWRKELADAGDFAPALAQHLLRAPADLPSMLCGQPVAWVIGETSAPAQVPGLEAAQLVKTVAGASLWRFTAPPMSAQDPRCAGTPNAGSPGR